jgi:hypothetical protein
MLNLQKEHPMLLSPSKHNNHTTNLESAIFDSEITKTCRWRSKIRPIRIPRAGSQEWFLVYKDRTWYIMPITTTTTTTIESKNQQLRLLKFIPRETLNPHYILTYDLVRNTKTLHYTIQTNQPPSSEREHPTSMRGYFGIMAENSCELNGNGEKVKIENPAKHMLWQPRNDRALKQEPLWHLRVSVLKDQEGQGDAPSRRFVSFFIVPQHWVESFLTG